MEDEYPKSNRSNKDQYVVRKEGLKDETLNFEITFCVYVVGMSLTNKLVEGTNVL